ncbi:unnamed protein product, partial [Prorocentrum cordatum]
HRQLDPVEVNSALLPTSLSQPRPCMEIGEAGSWRPVRLQGSRARSLNGGKDLQPDDEEKSLQDREQLKETGGARVQASAAGFEGVEPKEQKLGVKGAGLSRDFSGGAARCCPKVVAELKKETKGARGLDRDREKKVDEESVAMAHQRQTWGPPAPVVYEAMMENTSTKEIGAMNRKSLEAVKMTFTDVPPDYPRLCRFESCKDDKTIKLATALDDLAEERVVLDRFKAMGAIVIQGM